MLLLIFGSFVLMIWLIKLKLRVNFVQTPPGLDCDNVINNYSEANLQQNAYKEALNKKDNDPLSLNFQEIISRQGYLACFCENTSENSNFEYQVTTRDGGLTTYPICKKFQKDTDAVLGWGLLANAVSFLITLISFLLRNIFIFLMK